MIYVNEPFLIGNEWNYLKDCLDTNWISSGGKYLDLFQKGMAKLTNRKHAFAVSNGTIAIDIAIDSLNLKKGDEVIVPNFTIISCINQILRIGAVPVFVDAEKQTWNMDITKIESKITSKTKAIMAVHIYGLVCDMDKIIALCNKYNLKLIEDSAEAIGQTYKGIPCGSFGDISTTSFYANKHITSGEGGMIFTNDDKIAKKIKLLRNLGFSDDPSKRFIHESIGYNARMTNIQAAIGLAQLENLNKTITRKKEIGKLYNNLLKCNSKIQLPLESTDFCENHYWVCGVVLKNIKASNIISKLKKKGIETRPFVFPLNSQPIVKKLGRENYGDFKVSENLYENGLYLPSGIGLKNKDIEIVSQELLNIINES